VAHYRIRIERKSRHEKRTVQFVGQREGSSAGAQHPPGWAHRPFPGGHCLASKIVRPLPGQGEVKCPWRPPVFGAGRARLLPEWNGARRFDRLAMAKKRGKLAACWPVAGRLPGAADCATGRFFDGPTQALGPRGQGLVCPCVPLLQEQVRGQQAGERHGDGVWQASSTMLSYDKRMTGARAEVRGRGTQA
jgi:hypothetical protein